MSAPVAVQLYSVRENLASDYRPVIEQIASMGYAGVELAGVYFNGSARETAALLSELGLAVSSAHMPPPVGDNRNRTFDLLGDLGTTRLVVPYFPPEDFATEAQVIRICDILNESMTAAREHGVSLYYHNHWWEYERLGGTGEPVYQLMLRHLDPDVLFELDAYWVKAGGADPVAVLNQLGDRVGLLHVKDGTANPSDDMVAVGQGSLDYSAILKAAPQIDWAIVELDRCGTDMMEAVAASYRYLTERGLAHGR